ncbi:hypothetical protein [Nocardia jiangxiensis]|uniref:Uncharacterized protein n=1 Tax=Nocardia jiangxiensis TaxID=282685 RepID=A0ABW6RU01_9NOCA|nr:hypothetical protein [Nocardia jiangxiensis]
MVQSLKGHEDGSLSVVDGMFEPTTTVALGQEIFPLSGFRVTAGRGAVGFPVATW